MMALLRRMQPPYLSSRVEGANKVLVKFGILCGYTSVILVMLLGQSRVFFSMSRDGLVPGIFSQIHPQYCTPWRSNLLFMIFVAPVGGFLPLKIVGHMTSIA